MVGKHLLLTQAQDIFKFLFYDIKYSNTPSLKKNAFTYKTRRWLKGTTEVDGDIKHYHTEQKTSSTQLSAFTGPCKLFLHSHFLGKIIFLNTEWVKKLSDGDS